MILTQEQRALVIQDFVEIFKDKYGEEWMCFLQLKLSPSPIQMIAANRNIKVSHVKLVRRQMKVVGQYIELLRSLFLPISDESLWF